MKSRLHRIEITNFKAFRDLTSDFITYRFFFGFADLRNSEKFNIGPLFEKEILPFCVSTGGKEPLDVQSREGAEEQNDLGAGLLPWPLDVRGGVGGLQKLGAEQFDDGKEQKQ